MNTTSAGILRDFGRSGRIPGNSDKIFTEYRQNSGRILIEFWPNVQFEQILDIYIKYQICQITDNKAQSISRYVGTIEP